jgi:hypothetical protein
MAPKARRSRLPGYKLCHPTPALLDLTPNSNEEVKVIPLTPVSGQRRHDVNGVMPGLSGASCPDAAGMFSYFSGSTP